MVILRDARRFLVLVGKYQSALVMSFFYYLVVGPSWAIWRARGRHRAFRGDFNQPGWDDRSKGIADMRRPY